MRALVTGGAGFIGGHLCERLKEDGHFVTALDAFADIPYPSEIKRSVATLLAKKKIRINGVNFTSTAGIVEELYSNSIDTVFHLGALAGVRDSEKHPDLYKEANLLGTNNLLLAAHKAGVKRIIFASSSSVYGDREGAFKEADELNPISVYAHTKKQGEDLCKMFHSEYKLSITALRFFTVYGPRGRPDMAVGSFIPAIAQGNPVQVFGDGNQRRAFTYVSDIVDGILSAAEKTEGSSIFNLGNDQTVSVNRLIELICACLGKTPNIEYQPPKEGDVRQTSANIDKARAELGWSPKVSLEDGIKKTIQWYGENRSWYNGS